MRNVVAVLLMLAIIGCQPQNAIPTAASIGARSAEYRGPVECVSTQVVPPTQPIVEQLESQAYVDPQGYLASQAGVRYEIGAGISFGFLNLNIVDIDNIGNRTVIQLVGSASDETGQYRLSATLSYTQVQGNLECVSVVTQSSERSALNPINDNPINAFSGGPYLATSECSGTLTPQ